MKTNQNLVRQMGDFDVIQRTEDGYFDANMLLTQWNTSAGNTRRRIDEFLKSKNTEQFIESLTDEMSNGEISPFDDFQAIKLQKGRTIAGGGKTPSKVWMHPYLFTKFAMWINPTFEVKVIKFVYDQLIEFRNEAGDTYREMSSQIASISNKADIPVNITNVARAINGQVYDQCRIRNYKTIEL